MVVAFLTDYGLDDDFVGICHLVIERAAPGTRVIDLTHAIPRHDVRRGALALRRAARVAPGGVGASVSAVLLAVVDPGVGGARRAVAIRAGERFLVGPDNGLLLPAARALGGADEAVEISNSPYRLEPVSATFHGRDLFAPVAAALAAGAPLPAVGEAIDPASLADLDLPAGRVVAVGRAEAHVADVDTFGNVTLDIDDPRILTEIVRVNGRRATVARTFADVDPGALLIYVDSSGALALAVNQGSAADALALKPHDDVALEWTP
jgi:S-adenosyl-L-methionine hydrolase (adenosine-forming)